MKLPDRRLRCKRRSAITSTHCRGAADNCDDRAIRRHHNLREDCGLCFETLGFLAFRMISFRGAVCLGVPSALQSAPSDDPAAPDPTAGSGVTLTERRFY